MTLAKSELVRARLNILDASALDQGGWNTTELKVLADAFDLEYVEDELQGRSANVATMLRHASESTLLEIHELVVGRKFEPVSSPRSVQGDHLWRAGHVRLFISHSSAHKGFAMEVSSELAVLNIQGFVAHESIPEDSEWQKEIEVSLDSAEAFVGLIHPEFNSSSWCQQELGWAFGRHLPCKFIRLGADPQGFAGKVQSAALPADAAQVSGRIFRWLESVGGFAEAIGDGLFGALDAASNYYDAEAAAKRLFEYGPLTDFQHRRLARIFHENDQVGRSVLATRALAPLYERDKREFPPPPPPPTGS